MSTHVTIERRAISRDVSGTTAARRGWAAAGLGAGLAAVGTVVLTSGIDTVYQPRFQGHVDGVGSGLAGHVPAMFALHSVAVAGALLTVLFAVGLQRRLATGLARRGVEDSLAPGLALAGLLGTAVVTVLGTGLDTEVMMPLAGGMPLDDPTAAAYNHWVGTIPWVHVLTGLSALAVFAAARRGAVPRWLGLTGLVLGVLTAAVGVSPLQYMAVVPAAVWLLVTSVGLLAGDRHAE